MKNIFIIDDDKDIREVMCYVLESEGYRPMLFSTALDAFEALKNAEQLPHAIILDYMMPGMNGVEFLNKLSELPEAVQKIPVAFSSGMGKVEGVDVPNEVTFLSKPIDLEQLFSFLDKA